MTDFVSELPRLMAMVEHDRLSPDDLRRAASQAQALSNEAQREAQSLWAAGFAGPERPAAAELRRAHVSDLRQVAAALDQLDQHWRDIAQTLDDTSTLEVLHYAGGAVGSGVLGSLAYESLKAAVAGLTSRRSRGTPESEQQPKRWAVAREALQGHFAEHLTVADEILPVEPQEEEMIGADLWSLHFMTDRGNRYQVTLSEVPDAPTRIDSVKRVRQAQRP